MSDDLFPILSRWPWESDNTVRRILGDDGRDKIQIRVYLNGYHGILQFECDGRPDGQRPHGRDFALDYFLDRVNADPDLRLNQEQAQELFEEAVMVYRRYVVLFQLGDYLRVVRDTERNMRLFRFVNRRADRAEDRCYLERWWPYLIRIHHTAKAMIRLGDRDVTGAAEVIRTAIAEVEALHDMDDETFTYERDRSQKVLADLRRQLEKQRPLSEIEVLERMRDRAISREDFESAARLRDQINELKQADVRGGPR